MRLNCDRRSSLKGGRYVVHYYSLANHFKNDLITTVHQKTYTAEIKTDENVSEASDQDPTAGI